MKKNTTCDKKLEQLRVTILDKFGKYESNVKRVRDRLSSIPGMADECKWELIGIDICRRIIVRAFKEASSEKDENDDNG